MGKSLLHPTLPGQQGRVSTGTGGLTGVGVQCCSRPRWVALVSSGGDRSWE